MIKLEELKRNGSKFSLQSLYINPSWIITVREDFSLTNDLRCEQMKSKFPQDLDDRHVLSRLTYAEGASCSTVIVVGSPEVVFSKISKEKNTISGPLNILKG